MKGGVGIVGRTSESGAEGDEVPLPSVAKTEKAVGSNVVVAHGIMLPLGGLALVLYNKRKVEVEESKVCSRRWLSISISSMMESSDGMMMGGTSAFFAFP